MNRTPYPEAAGAICDNCQQNINWAMGGFHCSACEADLCQNCGQTRVSPPAMQPQGYTQPGYQQPPMGYQQPPMGAPGYQQPPMAPPMGYQQQPYGQPPPGGFNAPPPY